MDCGWGRPVDSVVDANGSLLISDDFSGTIYKLTHSATPPPSALVEPSNLSAVAVSTRQINLKWNDNSQNEDGFKIEQSVDGTNFREIGTVGANITAFSSTGLVRNRNYYFRVRAYNASGFSGYSNTVRVRTLRK